MMMFELQNHGSQDRGSVEAASAQEKEALSHVKVALGEAAVVGMPVAFLIGADGKRVPVPEPLFRILRQAAAMLARGQRITLAPVHQELSTQEAADQLGVSRPHLVKLLDEGRIPYSKTGRNRRVRFGDVVRFMEQRNAERRRRIREMIEQSEGDGLYDYEEFSLGSTR